MASIGKPRGLKHTSGKAGHKVTAHNLAKLVALVSMGCLASCQSIEYRSALPAAAFDRAGVPTAGWCHKLPQVAVAAHSKRVECVGLVDNQLEFPRGVLAWGNDILVVDKGSDLQQQADGVGNGRLLRYSPTATGFARTVILRGLNNPSSLSRGQHPADQHLVYISTPDTILRLAPDTAEPATQPQAVVSNLPLHGWHYISGVYATAKALLVTVPSASDHCESSTSLAGVQFPCPEVNPATKAANMTAAVRRYAIAADGTVATDFTLAGIGLRDALALLQTTDGRHLLAADNGWDNIFPTTDTDAGSHDFDRESVPLDELNLLPMHANSQSTPNYGWPYCYQADPTHTAVTPGYEGFLQDCSSYKQALQSLPAHSAPLALLYNNNQLLANLHGFASHGRRTLSWQIDDRGWPQGEPKLFIDWDYRQVSGYLGGRPFGLANYGPDRLLITDDWNRSLLIVYLH